MNCPTNSDCGQPHYGANRGLQGGKLIASVESRILVFDEGVVQGLELILRGEGSTRFHPNRRASTDHRPGPNMARELPMVPSKRAIHRSPAIVMICQVSSNATKAPTMGVHRPGMRRNPNPARNAEIIVEATEGSPHSVELARTTSEAPRTTRMRSSPIPGRPPANVEYKRRKRTLLIFTSL